MQAFRLFFKEFHVKETKVDDLGKYLIFVYYQIVILKNLLAWQLHISFKKAAYTAAKHMKFERVR
jgi:hypothetical protein